MATNDAEAVKKWKAATAPKETKPKVIGAAEVTRAQVADELSRRKAKRQGVGVCGKCGEQKQVVHTQQRSDSNEPSDLTSEDVGAVKEETACPSCESEKFKFPPLITETVGGRPPTAEESEHFAWQRGQGTDGGGLSGHYLRTGRPHMALSTMGDLQDFRAKNPDSFDFHLEGDDCDKGCKSMDERLSDPANADLISSNRAGNASQIARRAVVHFDLRTRDQKNPKSRSYSPTPMWTKDWTMSKFSPRHILDTVKNRWGSSVEGIKRAGVQNTQSSTTGTISVGYAGTAPAESGVKSGWRPSWDPEAMQAEGATMGTLMSRAHDRGAHEGPGRNFEDCPQCNPQ
jgi:hypothetical protein